MTAAVPGDERHQQTEEHGGRGGSGPVRAFDLMLDPIGAHPTGWLERLCLPLK